MSNMKAMNSRKRVSFGSKGSMVETWIIEDLPTPRTEKEEEFLASFVPHSKSDPGLESRDNPFLPGGDLSKEAEELLKKATIVRDKFYLQHEQDKLLHQADPLGSGPDPSLELAHDVVDRAILPNASANSAEVLEERICPSALTQVEAAAPPQLRENGKAGEAVPSDTSPDRVRLEVGDSPTADGNPGVVVIDTDNEQQDRDKGRRRPKCCLLM